VPTLRVPAGRGPDAAAHVAGRALVRGWRRTLGASSLILAIPQMM
jgi:hypothetical protein